MSDCGEACSYVSYHLSSLMPGPHNPSTPETAIAHCRTLEEDEATYCGKPATEGYPCPERCKVHQQQYRTMYGRYKEAARHVDEVTQSGSIPTTHEIELYDELEVVLKKINFVRKYIEAVRVERTGRRIHGTRFFLKIDDGHNQRLKLLEKEMVHAADTIRSLENRAYVLYTKRNPIPEWAKGMQHKAQKNKPEVSDEELLRSVVTFDPSQISLAGRPPRLMIEDSKDAGREDDDLIDMEMRARKVMLVDSILFFLGRDDTTGTFNDSEKDGLRRMYGSKFPIIQAVSRQYVRRMVFYDPNLFVKGIDKVSFEDFLLSDDLAFEDVFLLFKKLHPDGLLGSGLIPVKDAILETLFMAESGFLENAAKAGNPKNQIKILGGRIFNVPHTKAMSDYAWHLLIQMVAPPPNVEDRFVRLCKGHDDLIAFLTFSAFRSESRPSFIGDAWVYRNHLSMSGIIIADAVRGRRPEFPAGPSLYSKKPRKPGNVVWAEIETRAYLFGALKLESDTITEAFLKYLKSRPDLFSVLVRSQSDPPRKVELFGQGGNGTLPVMRKRFTECPSDSSDADMPPPPAYREAHGTWEVMHSAYDLLFSTKPNLLGYLTKLEHGNKIADTNKGFFRLKKFLVKYIIVVDPISNRHFTLLIQNVAWAALCAQGYGNKDYDYDERRYAVAADKLYAKRIDERLHFLPPEERTFNKMTDDL